MNIRVARTSDIPRVIDIRYTAYSQMAPQSYSAVEVETLLRDYTEDEFLEMVAERCLFVAVERDIILGSAGWNNTNIRHVYVDPNMFGKGIGSLLVQHVEADYKARTQHSTINAGVILYARGFYEKCGYQLIKQAKAWDGSDYYLMHKVLV